MPHSAALTQVVNSSTQRQQLGLERVTSEGGGNREQGSVQSGVRLAAGLGCGLEGGFSPCPVMLHVFDNGNPTPEPEAVLC